MEQTMINTQFNNANSSEGNGFLSAEESVFELTEVTEEEFLNQRDPSPFSTSHAFMAADYSPIKKEDPVISEVTELKEISEGLRSSLSSPMEKVEYMSSTIETQNSN